MQAPAASQVPTSTPFRTPVDLKRGMALQGKSPPRLTPPWLKGITLPVAPSSPVEVYCLHSRAVFGLPLAVTIRFYLHLAPA